MVLEVYDGTRGLWWYYAGWLYRSEVDIHSEAGCKKAESLYKELMLKITAVQESLRAQSSYVLEQTLDFFTACHEFKVR